MIETIIRNVFKVAFLLFMILSIKYWIESTKLMKEQEQRLIEKGFRIRNMSIVCIVIAIICLLQVLFLWYLFPNNTQTQQQEDHRIQIHHHVQNNVRNLRLVHHDGSRSRNVNITPLRILSWNICWGCVSENINDRTSKELVKRCLRIGGKKCLSNIANVITHKKYDIVALQEASKWRDIQTILRNKGRDYDVISCRKNQEDMATFYNTNRLELMGHIDGDISRGRPYQMIEFYDRKENKIFCFINLHNDHDISKKDLQDIIMNGFDRFKRSLNTSTLNGIIMAGDFNDHYQNYWKGFRINNSIKLSSPIKPPKTCCTGRDNIRTYSSHTDNMIGDYIIIDESEMLFTVVNKIVSHFNYDGRNFPTSDHLPVECQISYIR